jgi:hypothetical protein
MNTEREIIKILNGIQKDIEEIKRKREFEKVRLQKQGRHEIQGLKLVKGGVSKQD